MTFDALSNMVFDIPFAEIHPSDIEATFDRLRDETQETIDAIVQGTEPRTYKNVFEALENATEKLEYATGILDHLESVVTSPELRDAYNKTRPKVSEFFSRLRLNAGLWNAVRTVSESPEAKELDPVRARFLKKTVDDFRRHGADLPPEQKAQLAEIDIELTKVTTTFTQNVIDATNAFELIIEDESRLEGLPPSAIQAARQRAEQKGVAGWRFTLHEPSVVPVLTYAEDASLRETIWRAYNQRGATNPYDNRELVQKILELRKTKARLLGYKTFADLVLEDRMASNGTSAQEFIEHLRKRTEKHFRQENEELQKFQERVGGTRKTLNPWDVGYYAEKQRRADFDIDEEELRPYFPIDAVLQGLFEVVKRLYGVRVVPRTAPVWDPSVQTYSIHDETGELIAGFFADLFPRENKRGGAWMNGLVVRTEKNGTVIPHLALICANFTPPVGNKPALLTHSEVRTLFHEFGHLLHHAFSTVPVRSLAATHVAWDFVELPSQIMENWCWDPEALNLFAKHHETGESLPASLIEKMIKARNHRSANAMMRQLGFSSVDLSLHIDYDPAKDGAVGSYVRNAMRAFAPTALPDDYAMFMSFLHLFSDPVGYAAAYYSYKWAAVLDADAFGRFQKEGVFNRSTGDAFRREILAKGDSEDPSSLFATFMGREPKVDALLERSGLSE